MRGLEFLDMDDEEFEMTTFEKIHHRQKNKSHDDVVEDERRIKRELNKRKSAKNKEK